MKWSKRHTVRNPASPLYVLSYTVVALLGAIALSLAIWPVWTTLGEAIWVSIGTSFISTGVAGLVIYVYVRRSERLTATLDAVTEMGFVGAYSGRSVKIREQYDDRMARFSEGVDILGFGLNALRQDNASSFKVWKQRGYIRVLLIDPEYPTGAPFANQRDREENETSGTIAKQVRQFVRETAAVQEKGAFEIRLYRCLPMINIYRIDNEILWGPYLMHEQSRNTPTFIVRAGGELFDRLRSHFDEIWKSDELSREVPESWLRDTPPATPDRSRKRQRKTLE